VSSRPSCEGPGKAHRGLAARVPPRGLEGALGRSGMKPCARHDSRAWPGLVTVDSRGRPRIFLGTSPVPVPGWRLVRYGRKLAVERFVHPAANAGGWQWVIRYLVWEATGEVLRRDEHVHHACRHPWCVEPEHLEVVLAEYHGALHAFHTKLRDGRGRFAAEVPVGPYLVPRDRAVIGNAAR